MTWLIIILSVVILLFARTIFNKKIDASEKKQTVQKPIPSSESSLWDALCVKFKSYLDFAIVSQGVNLRTLENKKGEKLVFKKDVTDIIVTYYLKGIEKKDWKFPFWLHVNKAFEEIDKYYTKYKQAEIEIDCDYGIRSVYKQNGKYGLWNSGHTPRQSKKLTANIYDEICDRYVYARGWNRLIVVSSNSLVGLINIHGQKLLECKYNAILHENIQDEYNTAIYNDLTLFDEFGIKTELLNKWIECNIEEKNLSDKFDIETAYTLLDNRDSFIISLGLKKGVVGYYDVIILPCLYDEIIWVRDFIYIAKKNDMFGVLWAGNKILIPFKYNHVSYISISVDNPLFRVRKLNKEAIINIKEEFIIPFMLTTQLEHEMQRLYY